MIKKNSPVVFVLFICCTFFTGCNHIKQSRMPLKKGNTESGASGLQEDQSRFYYYLESRTHIKNQAFDKARNSLEKALAKDPGSFILTRDLIQLYLKNNNTKKAVFIAESLVRENPETVDGWLLLIQIKEDDIKEAEKVQILNKILTLDPRNKEIFLRLGKIHMENKNNKKALALFKKMVAQFPDYYVAWFYLGEAYLTEKNYDAAIRHFLKTIDLEPVLTEPRFQLIKIYKTKDEKHYRQEILEAYRRN